MTIHEHATGNLLLDAIPADARRELLSGSDELPIEAGRSYYLEGDLVGRLYFPISGVISITTRMRDDAMVEAATVGNEGFIVATAVLGSHYTGNEMYLGQIPGRTIVIDRQTFADAAGVPGVVQRLLHGYLQALFAQTAYSVACNARHDVDQRCARWLLETHDRIRDDVLLVPQTLIAAMLGVQRQTVTISALHLRRAGAIEYARGRIMILDRQALERAACECYEKVRAEYSRLVPLS
jgi:CRP-like cAMP-binding protein